MTETCSVKADFQWRIAPPPLPPSSSASVGCDSSNGKKRKRRHDLSKSTSSSSSYPCPYQVGDQVLITDPIREANEGKVIKVATSRRGDHHDERVSDEGTVVTVQMQSGRDSSTITSRSFNRREQQRFMQTCLYGIKSIMLCKETKDFRRLVHQVQSTDRVLELGCSTGELSKLLVKRTSTWTGMDNSQEMIDRCRTELLLATTKPKKATEGGVNVNINEETSTPNNNNNNYSQKLIKMDALLEPEKAYAEAIALGMPTVIFVDIGGNREYLPVVKLLTWVFRSFCGCLSPPAINNIGTRLIVVKSRALVNALVSCSSSVSSTTTSAQIDFRTGIVTNGSVWFAKARGEVSQNLEPVLPKHPLKAPMVYSPLDSTMPICRYHNYHPKGCRKYNDDCSSQTKELMQDQEAKKKNKYDHDSCPLDHDHCHACLERGHLARNCPSFVSQQTS